MNRILLIAVIALAINALAGVGAASDHRTPVRVVTGISFEVALGPRQHAGSGRVTFAQATCPKGTRAVAGGYLAAGTYADAPPSVLTSTPAAGGWRIALAEPGSGAGATGLNAEAICARITYATIAKA